MLPNASKKIDGAGEPLETQPENDAPISSDTFGMTDEQRFILNVVAEKHSDMLQLLHTLFMTNEVEEGELQPYDEELLTQSTVLFKIAFEKLRESVAGSHG